LIRFGQRERDNRKLQTNYLRNTSNILRWLPDERQQKDQNVPAQKSEVERSPKSAISHHFSIKIIQQEILQMHTRKNKRKQSKKIKILYPQKRSISYGYVVVSLLCKYGPHQLVTRFVVTI